MTRVARTRNQWRALFAAVLIVLFDSADIAPHRTDAARSLRADFNGNGEDDLVIGVPYEDIELTGGSIKLSIPNAGAVHVLYDGELGTNVETIRTFTQLTAGLAVQGAEGNDYFGFSLAIGNFNGDHYDDLAIGVPGEDLGAPTIVDAGGVHVLYGGPGGLDPTSSQFWHRQVPGLTNNAGGLAQRADRFGWALVALDADNDGNDELVVSAPYANQPARANIGVVVIIPGSATGLLAGFSQSLFPSAQPGALAGLALAAGDFNGDLCDDLAIGLPRDHLPGTRAAPGISDPGWVSVHYATCEPPEHRHTQHDRLEHASQPWHQDSADVAGTAEAGDAFGLTLAVGDFNGDTFDDLAIAAPDEGLRASLIGFEQFLAGVVHVLYGGPDGITATNNQLLSQSTLGASPERRDRFGQALAAADFNGDGTDDLAIGAPGEGAGALTGAGVVHVVRGGVEGLNVFDSQLWHQDSGPELVSPRETGDMFGRTLSAADFNGDNAFDLAIGVPGETNRTGVVHVLYGGTFVLGHPGGLSLTNGPGARTWQQSSAIGETPEPGDRFGAALPGSR